MKDKFPYELPEHYITIKISKLFIRVVDTDEPQIFYDIARFPTLTNEMIYDAFLNLASKKWINKKTLTRLMQIIIFEYPNLEVDWNKILFELVRLFQNKKIISMHIDQDQPYIDEAPWV